MKIVYKYFDILVNESEMITGNATKSLVRRAYDCKIKFSGKIVTIFDDYNFHTEQTTEYT